jgi:hypothetical protein
MCRDLYHQIVVGNYEPMVSGVALVFLGIFIFVGYKILVSKR